MCLGCVITPFVGSLFSSLGGPLFSQLGESFKIPLNRPKRIKFFNYSLPPLLTLITAQAIKAIFHISFCGAQGFSPGRALTITLGSSLLGMVYFVAVNCLINKVSAAPPARSCCQSHT